LMVQPSGVLLKLHIFRIFFIKFIIFLSEKK
jgi:hypothetical protein